MSWLQQKVSFYSSHFDNRGRVATLRDILLSKFAITHKYFDQESGTEKQTNDLETIIALRKMDRNSQAYEIDKKKLKATLQCYTPAAELETKKTGMVKVINRTNVMQLDFDQAGIQDYDIDELMRAVFNLPFIGFCGLSCSGDGFYALGLISEPEKLSDYAEHCFEILLTYGIKADTSKGKKIENLRYVSYDANMLIREDPKPLHVKYFKRKKVERSVSTINENYGLNIDHVDRRIAKGIAVIQSAQIGHRWETVQKVAYTLGGLGDSSLLSDIRQVIKQTAAFSGEEDKYCKCAEDCFNDGLKRPFKNQPSNDKVSSL